MRIIGIVRNSVIIMVSLNGVRNGEVMLVVIMLVFFGRKWCNGLEIRV